MAGVTEDRVVRELDVYLCNGCAPEHTKLYLMQYPLRPHWRPYDVEGATKVEVKLKAKRLQMSVPSEQGPGNSSSHSSGPPVLLKSNHVDLATSFAVGAIRGNRLLLVPLDGALQLRPSLAHLDESAAASGGGKAGGGAAAAADERHPSGGEMDEDDDKPGVMQQVSVSVQRRETDRQVEARQRSFAYQQQQEDAEPWAPLRSCPKPSPECDALWGKLMAPASRDLNMSLSRQQYLAALVPGASEGDLIDNTAAAVGAAAAAPGRPGSSGGGAAAAAAAAVAAAGPSRPGSGAPHQIDAAAVEQLPVALEALFRKRQSVCNLDAVRSWLRMYTGAGESAKAADAADSVLHAAIVAPGGVLHVRGRYMLASLGEGRVDPFRTLVLDILQTKSAPLKRAEVIEAARDAGQGLVVDNLYGKVMKDLCTSKSAQWTLKTGEPWES